MILPRLPHLLARFGTDRPGKHLAGVHAATWRHAAEAVPEILPDLIREGGILELHLPGEAMDPHAAMDPCRLAYVAGRRDLALQLLAAAGLTTDELNSLLKEPSA